jgi:hypothetical protein
MSNLTIKALLSYLQRMLKLMTRMIHTIGQRTRNPNLILSKVSFLNTLIVNGVMQDSSYPAMTRAQDKPVASLKTQLI